ncbi:MAG: hypothetical protein GF341_00435 [candidate division Zixibacteria bacterium]|nr:hypothetical protein [candidate division Zixibacteria bacterium]
MAAVISAAFELLMGPLAAGSPACDYAAVVSSYRCTPQNARWRTSHMKLVTRSVMITVLLLGSCAIVWADDSPGLEKGEFDIGGYLQVKYEDHEDSRNPIVDEDGNLLKRNMNHIYIRRGRIKVEYQATEASKFRIYFDGAKDKLSLLEAWIELKHEFGRVETKLRVGQQNIPFGFENWYSSAKRDLPERSLAQNSLFAGERERLVNLTVAPVQQLALNVAVLNGPGLKDSEFTYESPFEDTKDVLARLRTEHELDGLTISGGISGYLGKQFDESDTVDFRTDKNRYGADAQVEFNVVRDLGRSAVRGEMMIAEEFGLRKIGYYLWLSQRLGRHFGAAARYDVFDRNARAEDGTRTDRVSLAGNYYYDAHVRFTLSYDIIKNEDVGEMTDVADNVLTLMLQYAI